MTTDTRPSIAELEEKCVRDTFTDEGDIILAAPALIAIVKAAAAVIAAHDNEWCHGDAYYKTCADARQRLREALKAVRP